MLFRLCPGPSGGFLKKEAHQFQFIWLEWNSYNSCIQFHIFWPRSSIFKLKFSPAQGCIVVGDYFLIHVVFFQNLFVEIFFHCVLIAKFLCKVAQGAVFSKDWNSTSITIIHNPKHVRINPIGSDVYFERLRTGGWQLKNCELV